MALLPIISLSTTHATVHFSHHDVIGGVSDPTLKETAKTTDKSGLNPSRFIRAKTKILTSILRPPRYKNLCTDSTETSYSATILILPLATIFLQEATGNMPPCTLSQPIDSNSFFKAAQKNKDRL